MAEYGPVPLRRALSSHKTRTHTQTNTHLITLCLSVRVVIEDPNPSFKADTVAEPRGFWLQDSSSADKALASTMSDNSACVFHVIERVHLRVCMYRSFLSSIILCVALGIIVVQADVSSIQKPETTFQKAK